ncbi:protein TRANSPARENT TESTA 9 [Ipomoea triloba]|uniref:protein TRANSPARENT TESTA 9 n=1 Tax=Ipomoea triloba TaxID=35885 RepID=UPI00125CE5F6|nr:protein TRANSPARENT TESTA 9 [Ipomoea triloba]
MWSSFWRSRNRFSLDELRYLTDQLMKVQVVNEVNKDFVIEALRSIAELITYGDQHDGAFFEFFMEKQVMGEFVRILKISRTVIVSLQLLQTMSIMIQNLRREQSIYYIFCNEHINYLITYSFDFRNEELLSYYISFLRAISGKLNKNTISLLVKTQSDEVISFPLYVEAIRFAFHEEGMIRTAVRALTLNVYHVGDEAVNRYVVSAPHADYFISLIKFFREQCVSLNRLVSNASKNLGADAISSAISSVDEIEDNLYYISDVISAGIPDVGRLITDSILKFLIFPLILPSLRMEVVDDTEIGAATSLYLLCCILHIVKIKDLANTIAAALLCRIETFRPRSEAKINGYVASDGLTKECEESDNGDLKLKPDAGLLRVSVPKLSCSQNQLECKLQQDCSGSHFALREALLSYITCGNDVQVSGSLSVLATLLQTKELDEAMLDALGILPQRKQQKKLLLQALVGEESGEEQLFCSESNVTKDCFSGELDSYLEKLKDQYGVACSYQDIGTSPRVHRFQVLDALVSLFCRSNISAETLWHGGWLLRQLLPHSDANFNSNHRELLEGSYCSCTQRILEETRGTWPDLLIVVLSDEWRKCKRAIEASSPQKDPKSMLLQKKVSASEDMFSGDSSFAAGERMCEIVKVFVLVHQLRSFSIGKALPDQPPIQPPADSLESSRAKNAGMSGLSPKPNSEVNLVDAVPCRIAFERGKERHFCFLAITAGISGWLVLAEELPQKPRFGVVRVIAPLAGCNPRIDDKHSRWLHLRIRPSSFPYLDTGKYPSPSKVKVKALVDGRWTLAFRDEESCKSALSMILEEINFQSVEVERRIKPLLDIE